MEFQKQATRLAENNHKSMKNHKYTLDEYLQALLELDGKSD